MSKEDIKKHQFKKGQSGNPKGRPKGSPNLKRLYMDLLMLENEVMNPITGKAEKLNQFQQIAIAQIREARKGNTTAQEKVMERFLGKNKEIVDINGDVPSIDLRKLFNFKDED
tara:strand:- start:5369 stop:5707 length:339 start_codon:yes stop_codon:yes gene_type:complete